MDSEFDWSCLQGKQVSILLDGKDGKIENYLGVVENVCGNILDINPNNPNFPLDKIIIRTDIIRSVWMYRNQIPL